MLYRLFATTMCLALCGCASAPDHLVFVTATSGGINVDTTTPSASFAHDRVEGYFAPRYEGKAAPTVYASFESNGNIFDRKIKQLVATGTAAGIVSGATPNSGDGSGKPAAPALQTASFRLISTAPDANAAQGKTGVTDKAMFFGTDTTYGAKIGFSATALNAFVLGFKRKEMTLIPKGEKADDYPSLIASVQADDEVKADSNQSGALGKSKFDLRQFFATGKAADALANELRDDFTYNTHRMLDIYRENERNQSAMTLASLECLASVPDPMLDEVWDNAYKLSIFEKDTDASIKAIRAAPTKQGARAVYTAKIIQINPTSPYYTGLLKGHFASVCKSAGR